MNRVEAPRGAARGAPRRVSIWALVVALGLAAGAAGAVDKWIGFGDSIMVGSTWPFGSGSCSICPAVFDCSGGCAFSNTQSVRDMCGVPRRLDTWLDGQLGAADYVVNRGYGAELTVEGITRLQSELNADCPGSPGDCVAVVLMHGTNDMFGTVSPESATANLQLMIQEARSRNIDTLLMTIIRKIYEPTNSKWAAYHGLIVALAASENVPLVDPYTPLCPDTSCYNANYWVAGSCGGPGEPDVGHPDPDGYDIMGNLVTAAFPPGVPAAPTTTSPAGDITDTTPDFVWPEVAGARWYALEVDAATTWWEAAAHCSGGTCSVNPGAALSKGAHSWRVRGRNLRGPGSWSAATPFEIWGVPGTPAPMEPQGIYYDLDPLNPPYGWEPYQWSVAADATAYDLVVSDGGGMVFMESFASSACGGSVCSGSPGHGLAGGEYTFTVQARNPAVSGPVSAAQAFEIEDSVPGEATPTGPTGERFEPLAPLYEWLPASGATEYDLRVKDAGNNVDASATGLVASAVCAVGRCSYQGGTLPAPDDYRLEVLGRNPLGDGPWSSVAAEFTVLECVDPSQQDLHALAASPVTGPPAVVVEHCGPVRAAEAAPYVVESSGDLTVHTRDGFAAFPGFSVAGTFAVKNP